MKNFKDKYSNNLCFAKFFFLIFLIIFKLYDVRRKKRHIKIVQYTEKSYLY